jgi:hypothetical protein
MGDLGTKTEVHTDEAQHGSRQIDREHASDALCELMWAR